MIVVIFMRSEFDDFKNKGVVCFQISLLIGILFAFSFIIYSSDIVSAVWEKDTDSGWWIDSETGNMRDTDPTSVGSNVAVASTSTLVKPSSTVSKLLGIKYKDVSGAKAAGVGEWKVVGSGTDALVSGVEWAGIAYLAGTMVGDMFGMTDKNSEALGVSMAAGFGAGKAFATYNFESAKWFTKMNPTMVGAGIGAIVFVAMYKDVETKVVTFDCMPWQAPSGGNDCEVCNDDDLGCSEYRCKSLGQSCEIVNEGTADEKCVYVNPRDVDPPVIRPDYDELSAGHDYKNVKDIGEYNLALGDLGIVSDYEYFFEKVNVEGESFVYGVRDVELGDVIYFRCEVGERNEEVLGTIRVEEGFEGELFGFVMLFGGGEGEVYFEYLIGEK